MPAQAFSRERSRSLLHHSRTARDGLADNPALFSAAAQSPDPSCSNRTREQLAPGLAELTNLAVFRLLEGYEELITAAQIARNQQHRMVVVDHAQNGLHRPNLANRGGAQRRPAVRFSIEFSLRHHNPATRPADDWTAFSCLRILFIFLGGRWTLKVTRACSNLRMATLTS